MKVVEVMSSVKKNFVCEICGLQILIAYLMGKE